MGGRNFWTGFTRPSAGNEKPRFEAQRPNKAIATIEQCLKENGANAEVMAAFEELRAAADTPSPLYQMMVERFTTPGRGLTICEMALAGLYLNFRAVPTLTEIVSCMRLLVAAGRHDLAKDLYPNLNDELGGQHMKLLFMCMGRFADGLVVPHLTQQGYELAIDALDYQREHGGLPSVDELRSYKLKHGHNTEEYPLSAYKLALEIAPLLPPDAHDYHHQIQALTSAEAQNPKKLQNLCAASVRLAVRESDSTQQKGVVGLWKTLTDQYQGIFYHQPYHKIDTYARIHIGATDGVEDQHEQQANNMAREFVQKLLLQNPAELAAVFRQEAALCRLRTQQAQSFVNAMEKSRTQDWGTTRDFNECDIYRAFTPRPRDTRYDIYGVNRANHEIPPKPEPTPKYQQQCDLYAARFCRGLWTTATALGDPCGTIEDLLLGNRHDLSRRSPSR